MLQYKYTHYTHEGTIRTKIQYLGGLMSVLFFLWKRVRFQTSLQCLYVSFSLHEFLINRLLQFSLSDEHRTKFFSDFLSDVNQVRQASSCFTRHININYAVHINFTPVVRVRLPITLFTVLPDLPYSAGILFPRLEPQLFLKMSCVEPLLCRGNVYCDLLRKWRINNKINYSSRAIVINGL